MPLKHHKQKHMMRNQNDLIQQSAFLFRSTNASDWTVILGRLNQMGSNPNEVSIKVANLTISNGTGDNVAVLQLAVAPNLTNFIQPICVDVGDNTFSADTQCWAAGWGSGAGGGVNALKHYAKCLNMFVRFFIVIWHFFLICICFLPFIVNQTLQEYQTSVVSCGNSSSSNSICTSSLNLQEAS